MKGKKDKVSTPANTELGQQVRYVEFDGAFGNIQLAGDFLVGKIFQKRIENFLLAAAEICYGVRLEPARLIGQN